MSVTVGIDIGGTKVLGVVVDGDGTVLAEHVEPSEYGFEPLVECILRVLSAIGSPDAPIGVGAAGLVTLDGSLNYAPNIPNVVHAPLQRELSKRTGRPVAVDNDANVAALGEVTHGAAVGARDALMVTLGTGIGGGIILDGRVLRGAHGFAAEIGHFTVDRDGPVCACGERGHWESIASGSALGRMAREMIATGRAKAVLNAAHGRERRRPRRARTAGGVRRQRRARPRRPRQHPRPPTDRRRRRGDRARPPPVRPAAPRVRAARRRGRLPPRGSDRARVARGPCRRDRRRGPRPDVAHVSGVRVGVTLPSFVDDPEVPIAVARAAERAGVDAVFVFDHLFRDGPNGRRPALECFALLGAVAAETTTAQVGTLVARATLRPAATLAHCFNTVQRVSGGRLIAGIGAGDRHSRDENESYGLAFGTMADRVDALHDAVHASRGNGYPVWVGGQAAQVRELVALADGWNAWGSGIDAFRRDVEHVRELAAGATITWGGVVSFDASDRDDVVSGSPEQIAAQLRPYADAGAEWLLLAPLRASDPDNATRIGEQLMPLLG
jgi:alkanesulfonate monooxygenase SsuD/methylene tetrahydromethanopterin reductase-like flavin-dependent oxidoreductase (luciferase family)